MNEWLIAGALVILFLIFSQLGRPRPPDTPFELTDQAAFSHSQQN